MKSWNFTGTSTTLRDRSWTGWRHSGTGRGRVDDSIVSPTGVRNKGLISNHPKNVNSTCICPVFKMKGWKFTGTSVTLRDRSWNGWRFYRSPIGVRNKGLITQKTWIRRAFAQFSRWRVETSQECRWLTVTGRVFIASDYNNFIIIFFVDYATDA